MANITIIKREENKNGWEFNVNVDGLIFEVNLDKDYYEKLTNNHISPNSLVIKSFEFLLRKESKESILKSFNLKDINKYFPGYEREVNL
jgi:hypothetical protein